MAGAMAIKSSRGLSGAGLNSNAMKSLANDTGAAGKQEAGDGDDDNE